MQELKTKSEIKKEIALERLLSFLVELYGELKHGAKHLALHKLAQKHQLQPTLVTGMIDMEIVKGHGSRRDILYTWTKGAPDQDLAERIYADVQRKININKSNEQERERYNKNLRGKNLVQIKGVVLSIPNTVHKFLLEIYNKCKSVARKEAYDMLAGQSNFSDYEVKKSILVYLREMGVVIERSGLMTWNDAFPDADFAKAIISDIEQKGSDISNDHRSKEVYIKIKAAFEASRDKGFITDEHPFRHLSNHNVICSVTGPKYLGYVTKIDKKYRIILTTGETIEEAALRVHKAVSEYARKAYHVRASEKRSGSAEHRDDNRLKQTPITAIPTSLDEMFKKASMLMSFKTSILENIRSYQKEIKGTGIEDNLYEEIQKIFDR